MHSHILVSSLISIITQEFLVCYSALPQAPQWYHGEYIGHLAHAPCVSEYIANIAISSRPLKHHVPHGAVWVGGLNIYQWISSLKCHLAFNIKPILYFMFKCHIFTLMFNAFSQWLLTAKRHQSRTYWGLVFETSAMPDIVLTQTFLTQCPSACIHYWLVLYWLLLL